MSRLVTGCSKLLRETATPKCSSGPGSYGRLPCRREEKGTKLVDSSMRGALAGVSVPILLTTSPATGASQDVVLGQMVPNARNSRKAHNNSTRQSLDHKIIRDLGSVSPRSESQAALATAGSCIQTGWRSTDPVRLVGRSCQRTLQIEASDH